MYISYNWLQDFIKIPNKVEIQSIADKLTLHTVEVENFTYQADRYQNIIVAKVLEVNKHPNANKLQLALVDTGDEKLNIVCGANNIAPGQMVPLAREGAILPNGLEIKASEIRGELSQGMICSEDELALSNDHEGIMVLDKKAKAGEELSHYLKLNDLVLEIDNTSLSNRADLFSHYGIARELAAILDIKLKPYNKVLDPDFKLNINNNDLDIEIEDKQAVVRYSALKINNIKVEESPAWLKNRLIAVGQKPINNIVDLANYVMIETGQPLHTFDAHKIKKIRVRLAENNEKMEALDGKEYELGVNDIVISDGKNPIALAGIIGATNSEINQDTNSIILESANFRAENIRRSSQRLNLRTEASVRFEKSVDPELSLVAINRFVTLLKEMQADIEINESAFDLYPHKLEDKKINLNLKWLNKKTGAKIPQDSVEKILKLLGFKINKLNSNDEIEVITPSWRAVKDVSIPEDLLEEVLRIYGFNKIPASLPVEKLRAPNLDHKIFINRKIKKVLAYRFNLNEVQNYAFTGEAFLDKLNIDHSNYLRLANPSSNEQALLNQSLAPQLINNIKNNQNKSSELGLFELANVFFNFPGSLEKNYEDEEKLPYQEKKLAIGLSSKHGDLFTQAKDLVYGFCREIVGKNLDIVFDEMDNFPSWSDKERAVKVMLNQENIAYIALINPIISKNLNLKTNLVIIEFSMPALYRVIDQQAPLSFSEGIKYPSVNRDLSFVFSQKILYNTIKEEIIKFNPLIKSVELIDAYTGGKIAKNEKGFTFRLTFQASDRTLVSSEVDGIQNSLINKINERFQARLREI